MSSTNPLPANFGTEVLFDVATKSPICCHIDFLGAGVSRRSEGRDPGQSSPVVGAGVCPEPCVTLRARAGADWSQRRLRLRLADTRGRGRGGNGMRYEMVYTLHPGSRYITRIFHHSFLNVYFLPKGTIWVVVARVFTNQYSS